MLHNLDLMAKQLREMVPALQVKVRGCKAAMTRVKLAQEYDMGVGYSAIKAPKAKADADGYRYKLRYGLVSTTTVLNEQQQSESVWVDAARYAARQQEALRFKSILGKRDAKNEIVIAIRHHAGPFPVYAVREGNVLKCYDIVNGDMKENGKTISENGVMTG